MYIYIYTFSRLVHLHRSSPLILLPSPSLCAYSYGARCYGAMQFWSVDVCSCGAMELWSNADIMQLCSYEVRYGAVSLRIYRAIALSLSLSLIVFMHICIYIQRIIYTYIYIYIYGYGLTILFISTDVYTHTIYIYIYIFNRLVYIHGSPSFSLSPSPLLCAYSHGAICYGAMQF